MQESGRFIRPCKPLNQNRGMPPHIYTSQELHHGCSKIFSGRSNSRLWPLIQNRGTSNREIEGLKSQMGSEESYWWPLRRGILSRKRVYHIQATEKKETL
ncbi:hypothetical protein KY289_026887 [Solanum tuberosum]|nr:hypothetical protein KY289_026887 [Solanum tuberosum]